MLSMLSSEKLSRLFLLKEVKPSPDGKMIKLLIFNSLFPSLRYFCKPEAYNPVQGYNLFPS